MRRLDSIGSKVVTSWLRTRRAAQLRTIVLIDESGLSKRPYRVRTWVPRGTGPAAVSFHLEGALGCRRHQLVETFTSGFTPGRYPYRPGHRFPS
jgi:hypothetical protein